MRARHRDAKERHRLRRPPLTREEGRVPRLVLRVAAAEHQRPLECGPGLPPVPMQRHLDAGLGQPALPRTRIGHPRLRNQTLCLLEIRPRIGAEERPGRMAIRFQGNQERMIGFDVQRLIEERQRQRRTRQGPLVNRHLGVGNEPLHPFTQGEQRRTIDKSCAVAPRGQFDSDQWCRGKRLVVLFELGAKPGGDHADLFRTVDPQFVRQPFLIEPSRLTSKGNGNDALEQREFLGREEARMTEPAELLMTSCSAGFIFCRFSNLASYPVR